LGSLTKSQTFDPDWLELCHKQPSKAQMGRKIWFSRTRSSITSFLHTK